MADGFIATGQEERAIKLLNKYIPQIPEEPEYYLIKAAYLGKRGYAYYQLQEYGLAIEDEKAAVLLAQNTVDGKSQELMILYKRLAESYQEAGDDHEILSVLYNNAGAVTVDLPEQDAGEERLERAMGLCEDPYLKLVIGANQICRVNEDDSDRKIGRTIARGEEAGKKGETIRRGYPFCPTVV